MSHTLNELTAHKNDTANPHSTDIGNLGSGTLAELNTAVTDATLIAEGGHLVLSIVSTSAANYTVLSSDYTILADSTSNDVTIDLPAAAGQDGRILHIKLTNATNTAIIDPNLAETIDGVATATISVLNDSLKIQCDGAAWYIL